MTNRGSALLSALFIMSLVAIAATAMSTRLQLDIYRTHQTLSSDQLVLTSQAVAFWAKNTLTAAKSPFLSIGKQGLIKRFPADLESINPGVVLKGDLYDLQALFNLNNLQDKKAYPIFDRFLKSILTKKTGAERTLIIHSIAYWVSPYQADQDHELALYLQKDPPYLPSHQPMSNPSELRLVNGINETVYQTLLPYVCALPERTTININTAPALLLASLGHGLSGEQVKKLLEKRKNNVIKNLQGIQPLLQELDIPVDQITTDSSYFLSVATATSNDLHVTTHTLLKRTKNAEGVVRVKMIGDY